MSYIEHEEVRNRRWFDTEKFLDVHQVKFTGFRCPKPLFKFEHAFLPEFITETIAKDTTYTRPTALQCFCWPILLSNRDLIAVSNSAYGKHLAYMIPALVHFKRRQSIDEQATQVGPSILILTPYLASKDDILGICKAYIDAADAKCIQIYENEEKDEQISRLKTKFDILIANPLRLLELIDLNESILSLNSISFLIVDEYIQFRKMQIMDDVKRLVEKIHNKHQTMVYSRLVPSGIQRQGDEFVKNCVFFEMHHDRESPNDEVKQIIELIDKNFKISRLIELVDRLTRDNDCKILIYAKDKEKCLSINQELKRHLDLDALDFRKDESRYATTPNAIMSTFKNIGLEIAIPDLQFIINVDFPPNIQTYMDRLRKSVVHYTFFAREDAKHAERLIYSLKQARQEFDPHLQTMAKAWLECGRDLRFLTMMEDIKNGISKPLLEMMISSSDEESILNSATSGYVSNENQINQRRNSGETASSSDTEDYDEDLDENPIQ